jgi:hypothetical protein
MQSVRNSHAAPGNADVLARYAACCADAVDSQKGADQIPRARWFYFVHNEAAGLVLTPSLIAAAYAISWGMVRRDYQLYSRTHLLMVVIAAVSCLWYNASIACWGYTSFYWRGGSLSGRRASVVSGDIGRQFYAPRELDDALRRTV